MTQYIHDVPVAVIYPRPWEDLFEGRGHGDGNAFPFEDCGYGKGRTRSKGMLIGDGSGSGEAIPWGWIDGAAHYGGLGFGLSSGAAELEGGGEGCGDDAGEEGTDDTFNFGELDDDITW